MKHAQSTRWVAVHNAFGEWGVIGRYATKQEAVVAVQVYEGNAQRPDKYGVMGNHGVMRAVDFDVHYPHTSHKEGV